MPETNYEKGRAWVELDMESLGHNVSVLRALLPEGCRLMPAVKANAYGHGAVPVARELNRLGVQAFCVATAEEGAQLRRSGITGEILVLGYTHPRRLGLVTQFELTQSVVDFEYAALLEQTSLPLRVHIAVDTGMHRIGERSGQLTRILKIFHMRNLQVTGIFTHLCVSDGRGAEAEAFTSGQAAAFWGLVDELRRRGYRPRAHILNSCGLLRYPMYGGDYARVGIALYGLLSRREDADGTMPELRPVLSVKARVAHVAELLAGEGAGYGLSYVAGRDGRIAVITIGYADGIPRSLSCGRGGVLIRGRRAPIVGRICMDQLLADVTEIPETASGDTAVLIGRDGELEISAYELAEADGTITNELLSRLGSRLSRPN